MYQNEKVNKELKSILSQFKDSYRMSCDSSRNDYMRTLSAGSQIPKEGLIYGVKARDEFESMCEGYRTKAREIIDGVLADLIDKETEAPSTEAVNAISLLNMRNDITADEIENMLGKYGDNPQAWKTIVSIAKSHDIHGFRDHDIEEKIANVDGIGKTFDKTITASGAESGHASDGFLAMVEGEIDSVFPIKEIA